MKKHVDYRHFLCGGFLAGSVALTFTVYRVAIFRMGEAFRNLWQSLKLFWFFFIDRETDTEATVLNLQNIPIGNYLPFDVDELIRKLKALPQAFIRKDLFLDYAEQATKGFLLFVTTAALIVCMILLVVQIWKLLALTPNTDHGKESKPLKAWKKTGFRAFCTVRDWILSFIGFLADHSFWWKLWLFVWVINCNLGGLIVDAAAWYFYFAVSADLGSLATSQVFKLALDLVVTFCSLPAVCWAVVGFLLFDLWRRHIGYKVLEHHEAENRAFLEDLPIVLFINGTMGSKKTTTMTDMALSYEIMFRDKALELILEIDLMFPRFP